MQANRITLLSKKRKPKSSKVYDTYWKFASERQNIFFNRIEKPMQHPWTKDFVLRNFKFTNAYRVSDRVSQYLISNIIQNGNQNIDEVFFRIILFKLFNKIETWEYLQKQVGELFYSDFKFERYSEALALLKLRGQAIYSNAYIMASGKSSFNHEYKHDNHLRLIQAMMQDSIARKLQECNSMKQAYEILLKFPTIGSFLAYQYVTDINYSNITMFSEMEFVKAGPGAKDGIRKCFSDYGDYSEEDIIKLVCETQENEFERLGLEFKTLWGRRLQLIDCQNLFCEVDKYSRVVHPNVIGHSKRTRIKQKFQPSSLIPINYSFPEKWNIKIDRVYG
ncbi:nucleotide kinase domain-containing protein [Agriterribacter humi]|uniref:nucleotide kinase domain-containing protein n=1 Tax=Agriterribacter humi TaxID=1104781 RepID=UPI001D0222AD|nr:nucleotide kinase domain-containing protein [Agriterribacter humi]